MTSDRFWKRVDVRGHDECWPWKGRLTSKGYGVFWRNKTGVRSHRYAYETAKGPIPDGMLVCHQCDNPPCCNPEHLWLGSAAENNADALLKGRRKAPVGPDMRGEKHPLAKLTDAQREELKKARAGGLSYRRLGAIFGVAARTAHEIVNGRDYSYRK